jgi:CRISPR system Cascade subunit CasD
MTPDAQWLLFTLAAPMASFGGIAVGEVRGSDPVPSRSAVLGLVAAALGIRREDTAGLTELSDAIKVASRVERAGVRQVDYHTAQAPKRVALKGRPQLTRRDEMSVPKSGLNTVLSQREYHADFAATVALKVSAPLHAADLRAALLKPKFTLYIGRKAFPLAWPLAAEVLAADDLLHALAQYDVIRSAQEQRWRDTRSHLHWPLQPSRAPQLDYEPQMVSQPQPGERHILRRDQPGDRKQWLFADHAHIRVQGGGP